MDLQGACDGSIKKVQSFENLSKEELIKKCKSLLIIAQKAKQSKDDLYEENNELKIKVTNVEKSLQVSNEIVENVTRQKLELVNTIEGLKQQTNTMTDMSVKMSDLDTENISYRRQVNRLTDENEQLITHLENLEKKIEQLTQEGLEQQQKLLTLEEKNKLLKDNENLQELQTMLARTLEEVKTLQDQIGLKDERIKNCQLDLKELETTRKELQEIKKELQETKNELQETKNELQETKDELQVKEDSLRKNVEMMDELRTDMHKNHALNERLQQEVKNTNERLSDNQIFTSGFTSDLENSNTKLREKLKNYHTKIVKLANDVKALKQSRCDLLDNFKLYTEQVKVWKNALNKVVEALKCQEKKHETLITENSAYKKTIENMEAKENDLQEQYENLRRTHEKDMELGEKSSEEILNLVHENKKLTQQNETLTSELEEVRLKKLRNKDACHQTIDEFPDTDSNEQLTTLKREHHEVLNEMNEMNQALKERGETISKQRAYCDELLKKIQIFETQLNKKCELLNEKDETINKLRNEIENAYPESETMSTSTISKTEETNRLKDLEGSWEERYGKLRSLAIKLKGKIRTLTNDLTKELNEKSELQNKIANNMKLIQNFQMQNDRLQDELETNKKEMKECLKRIDLLVEDVGKATNRLASDQEEIAKLTAEIERLNKDRCNVEDWKKQVGVKVQSLKREIEANVLVRKDSEARIAKLQSDLEKAEKLLKEEREKHNETRNSLQESNNEWKKQSVLNLEMHDYERTVKDLSQKLDKKQEVINKLKNQFEAQKATSNSLKEQNRILAERYDAEKADLETNNHELRAYKTKMNELETLLMARDAKILEMTHVVENVRIENEDLSTQLSTSVADNQKTIDIVKTEKENLRIVNIGLEQTVREIRSALDLKCDELEKIKEEHRAYKVRAQSVLRQNQVRDVGQDEKLNEEIATLQTQNDILTSEIDDLKARLERADTQNQQIFRDYATINAENAEVKEEIDEWKKKYSQLHEKHQQTVSESAETIRGLKVHADTLSQCYRQQLTDQETRHNREIVELQSKVEKGNVPPEMPSFVFPSMQREEGEGSESVESTGYAASSQPVPLEKLLSLDNDPEMTIVRKQLLENESKVVHLTALLADTEQDLVKHVQMNKLLKEEIRRQQRSVEREQHAENLEYLKNVVFKFLTLGNGDERVRLVPVLNTILKLSPDETNKLNMVAKGADKGWSNYLPIWQ